MKIIDATFWTNHPDPMRPEIRGDRERYLAGERLHPELPEFVQGSFLQRDINFDHANVAQWLAKHKGIATMDYEPEVFRYPLTLNAVVGAAARVYDARNVPSMNYDVAIDPVNSYLPYEDAGLDYASVQLYYHGPNENAKAWLYRAVDRYRKWQSATTLPMAVWLNTHEIRKDALGNLDCYSPPLSMGVMRLVMGVVKLLDPACLVLWSYRNDAFDVNLPEFVAAKEML